MRLLLTLAMCLAFSGSLPGGERDVVKPIIGDKTDPGTPHTSGDGGRGDRPPYRGPDLQELHGPRSGPRLAGQVQEPNGPRGPAQRLLRHRQGPGRGQPVCSVHRRPEVAARAQYIMDQLRGSRDPDGYLGLLERRTEWLPERRQLDPPRAGVHQSGLGAELPVDGEPQALADAKVMADYIMRMFPANEQGENMSFPPVRPSRESRRDFVELYRVTGEDEVPRLRQAPAIRAALVLPETV